MSGSVCYLCGLPISEKVSRDHVVPKQIIEREQPRAKGFDYGGVLPTHERCNNDFGPEAVFRTATRLLPLLVGDMGRRTIRHPEDPLVKMRIWNSGRYSWMTEAERRFFGFIDATSYEDGSLPSLDFLESQKKSNPLGHALRITYSVLTKSAMAILIAKYGVDLPREWIVYASAFFAHGSEFSLTDLTDDTWIFDQGVEASVSQETSSDWAILYKVGPVILVLAVSLAGADRLIGFRDKLPGNDIYVFRGKSLNDLLTIGWTKAPPGVWRVGESCRLRWAYRIGYRTVVDYPS